MSYETQYRPQQQSPTAPHEMDMGSLFIGLLAGFVGGLIGIAITYFWGSKITRQDRLIGAVVGTVVAIVLVVLAQTQGG